MIEILMLFTVRYFYQNSVCKLAAIFFERCHHNQKNDNQSYCSEEYHIIHTVS